MNKPKITSIDVQKTLSRFNTTVKYQSVLKVIQNEMKNKKVKQRFSIILHYVDDDGHCITRNDVLFIARYLFAIGESLSYFESSEIKKGEKMVLTVANSNELFKKSEVKETSETEISETSETSETSENATENATETETTENATETPATETETETPTETTGNVLDDVIHAIVRDFGIHAVINEFICIYGIDAVQNEIDKLK